ncbi:hypothetical protein [Psychroserpens sp. S379A]|uniref:hypothetical protein n=1 Tax=Psychroserpens sp. S379A TaxID=3415137 RepID=UPI003C7E41D4
MKSYIYLIIFLLFFSCGKDKSVLLPEIEHAKITEILDVSPAYLFYDETQPDSIELNRKNLIGTTNWLFNVDKRLTLEQAIPKIKFLQDKKRNAQMHKNENAKNYYTCNDTSIQNLGFIEFTEVRYQTIPLRDYFKDKAQYEKMSLGLNIISEHNYSLESSYKGKSNTELYSNINEVIDKIDEYYSIESDVKLYLLFHSKLSFQNYISIKSKMQTIIDKGILIDNNEFIY